MSSLGTSKVNKILVLGGSGFVGQLVIKKLIKTNKNIEIIALSRRGNPSIDESTCSSNDRSSNYLSNPSIIWIKGDAADEQVIKNLSINYGPFDACVHCIGLLLDSNSGLSGLNVYASGSGSLPDSTSTYDKITRLTAFLSIDLIANQTNKQRVPYVFVSAAEAGWSFKAPLDFLERYLVAKRAVENKLLTTSNVRAVIMRPSLIWTWNRPQALLSVIPFYIGYFAGIPIIDRPVLIDDLADAIIKSIFDESVYGIKSFKEIDELAK